MDPKRTALILIGYQNDYFSPQGVLYPVVEEPGRLAQTLERTLTVIDGLAPTAALMVTTPIRFTPDYAELVDPVGILQSVRQLGALKAGTRGADTIPELRRYGDRLLEVPGKRGLNAFSNTQLDEILQERGIHDVVLAGVVASICIDSTGRAALEKGYKVTMLSDCISGRTPFEEAFYRDQIYPLYAQVLTSSEFLSELHPVQ